ncbi:MAG: class I SAM-dependent methyltransferase [Solirubrobacteraceae bacterium]
MTTAQLASIWHDLECGGYAADLPLWRALAREAGGAVLDIGAGTGRVALDLARAGYDVTALDSDESLLAALRARADGLGVRTIAADAREFAIDARYALCVVPMQTVQLLGGAAGRAAFLRCTRRHLASGGLLAVAIAAELEPFEVGPGEPGPLPDLVQRDGVVYSSRPTAVRAQPGGHLLERRREVVSLDGQLTVLRDAVWLDRLDAATLDRELVGSGLRAAGRTEIDPTDEYVGSTVVMARA